MRFVFKTKKIAKITCSLSKKLLRMDLMFGNTTDIVLLEFQSRLAYNPGAHFLFKVDN